MVFNLLCHDCKEENPEFQKFLKMNWTTPTGKDITVKEQITLTYAFLPLTFHHAVWVPHKLLPFLID